MRRVKFYSVHDMINGYYLPGIAEILEGFNPVKDITDYRINEIIELYNVKQFIDEGVYHKEWSKEDIERFKNVVQIFPSIIGKCFSLITDENILDLLLSVDIKYKEDFWSLFEKLRTYERISKNTFSILINQKEVALYKIFKMP